MMSESNTQNVDQIREILFGSHIRVFEKRLQSLEEQFKKGSKDLRDEIVQSGNETRDSLRVELTSLKEKLGKESSERTNELEKLNKLTDKSSSEFDDRLGKLERKLDEVEESFHAQLLEQSKFIYSEIQEQLAKMSARFEKTLYILETEKIDSEQISGVLRRLSDEIAASSPKRVTGMEDEKRVLEQKSSANNSREKRLAETRESSTHADEADEDIGIFEAADEDYPEDIEKVALKASKS